MYRVCIYSFWGRLSTSDVAEWFIELKRISSMSLIFSFNFIVTLQNPKWDPPTLEDVNMDEVESVFEPLAADAELNV